MLTVISVVVVLAIITLIISLFRAFKLRPLETSIPNSGLVYSEDNWRSKEVYEKSTLKNHLILKVSLTISVVGGIAVFILKSI